jgi:dephospho-CoA kinase
VSLNVGLTGNIGSGKSTVARLFTRQGAALIDADELARAATEDADVLEAIAQTFGEGVVENGVLNRTKLASVVFDDEEARKKLNAIVHPWVAAERERRVAALSARDTPPDVIIHDIPLLFEVGLDAEMDKTVVVRAPLELRVARVVARSGLTPDEVRARDTAQLPLSEKVQRADFVIDNRGGAEALEVQVRKVWRQLLEAARDV